MKIKNYIKLFYISVFGFIITNSNAQSINLCDTAIYNCVDEEILTYKIYYNLSFIWIPTGEVIFKTKETEKYYEIEVNGRTYGAYDHIFKVRDYFFTRIDKETMKPILFIRDVQEGNYKKYYKTHFNHEELIAKSISGKTKETAGPIECSLEDYCIQDVISVVYLLRGINLDELQQGDNFDLDIYMDNKIYDVNLMYDGHDYKKSIRNLGTYNTHLIIPETITGNVFDEEDKMKIWVSDDNNRIPLLIESPISVGSIRAVLKEYSGLADKL